MALKKYNPRTPGQRQLVLAKSDVWKGAPYKPLTVGLTKSGGRNNHGHITCRHIGGGHKRKYRLVDFKRSKLDVVAIVERIEYDPNRSSLIALIKYDDGVFSYVLAPQKLEIGDKIVSSIKAEPNVGNCMKLKNIPVGTTVHNVEIKPEKGGQIARSAGAYAQIVARGVDYIQLRLRSGEVRYIPSECFATIGVLSNPDNQNQKLGKAGRSVWLGRRPSVRGVAMNPVDHPHGGGEGKTSGGRHPVTPWGISTKGKRTRSNKSTNKFIVRKRYKKG